MPFSLFGPCRVLSPRQTFLARPGLSRQTGNVIIVVGTAFQLLMVTLPCLGTRACPHKTFDPTKSTLQLGAMPLASTMLELLLADLAAGALLVRREAGVT